MGKAEKGTPKDIANKIKAKGLQKLKFYCQMCQKQCRDANGFKCHMTSETHLRNMKIFSQNASRIMDDMSRDFEVTYLDTLRRRHGTKRVNANNVYQEVIQDRHHIHMNATKWATLTDFCQYLGRTGRCVVDETERGWYVQYIERDANVLARQEAQRKRVEAERAAEETFAKQMEIQRTEAARLLDRSGNNLHTEATKLERGEGEDGGSDNVKANISLSLSKAKKSDARRPATASMNKSSFFGGDDDDDDEDDDDDDCSEQDEKDDAKPPGAAPTIDQHLLRKSRNLELKRSGVASVRSTSEQFPQRQEEESERKSNRKRRRDEDDQRTDHWLRRDIIVRIIAKKLANGKYFKRKAVVDRVLDDKFTAEVEVLDSGPDERDGGDVLRLDQDDLETVVPREGKVVRILNGRGQGMKARVVALDKDRAEADLELLNDSSKVLRKVLYEDFSKLA